MAGDKQRSGGQDERGAESESEVVSRKSEVKSPEATGRAERGRWRPGAAIIKRQGSAVLHGGGAYAAMDGRGFYGDDQGR